MTPWAKPGGFSGGGFQDNAWLGNAKRQSLFRAAAPNVPWATSKPAATPSLTQPAASNQQVGQPVQQPPASQPASLFSGASEPRDVFGRTASQARSWVGENQAQEADIDSVRRQMGLDPINRGYNQDYNPQNLNLQTMQPQGWQNVDPAAYQRQQQLKGAERFRNDPRRHEGQSLYDIFSSAGASHSLRGTGSY